MNDQSTHNPVGIGVSIERLAFDGVPLIENLSFALKPGQWTCLLGASGIGKTSILRAMCGLLDDRDCRIGMRSSDGRDLNSRIAYMAQQDLLLPWLNARDNVLLGSRLRNDKEFHTAGHEAALNMLDRVGLREHAEKLPAKLSGGMRQRVALARTLMENRPVVIMDEPFSALDAITRVKLQEIASGVLAGKTVLFVTHDPMEALRLGDRILVLSGAPATLEQSEELTGDKPRPLDDPAILRHHARLIAQLGGDAGAAAGGTMAA